mmetsp:Transcript_160253/g.282700  ORF Transcript_160253/g.282700 Transcript_160253/m.282700 type:complete len:111 (+) Transcript_160253:138-470(+)
MAAWSEDGQTDVPHCKIPAAYLKTDVQSWQLESSATVIIGEVQLHLDDDCHHRRGGAAPGQRLASLGRWICTWTTSAIIGEVEAEPWQQEEPFSWQMRPLSSALRPLPFS